MIWLFSSYADFQARTLDAFERADECFQTYRIERVCRFLASNDPFITKLLDETIKQDPEIPVVVPFSYFELSLSKSEAYFVDRVRRHFYFRDLFAFQSPLKRDIYFFGRQELIHSVLNRARSNENTGIFGLRRSGKTSVVYGLERALRATGDCHLALDCQNTSVYQRRWNDLLKHIIAAAMKKYSVPQKRMPPQTDFSPLEASTTFKECIKAILSFKKRTRFFLMFDEIERITFETGAAEHWRGGNDFLEFWRSLRALFQENPELISFIVVGTNPKCIEDAKWKSQDNPIFNSFYVDYLQGFSYEQTVGMVQSLGGYMGLEFSPKICALLHDDYGGHPYLMRHMCSTVHKLIPRNRPTTVPQHTYEEARKDYEQQISPYIASIVDSLKEDYPFEYDMLLELAVGEYQTFLELASEEPRVLHHLLSYGLIEREGDRYRFRVQAVQRYLVRVRQFYRKADKLQEKWAEVSERRNKLEVGLRRMISLQLKANYGEKVGKTRLLAALGGDRAKKMDSMRFEQITNPTDSPLYFSDLYAIVKQEWSLFENFFSENQHRIVMRLEHINKMRRDAHARSINDGDFVDLRRDFEVIEHDLRDLLY